MARAARLYIGGARGRGRGGRGDLRRPRKGERGDKRRNESSYRFALCFSALREPRREGLYFIAVLRRTQNWKGLLGKERNWETYNDQLSISKEGDLLKQFGEREARRADHSELETLFGVNLPKLEGATGGRGEKKTVREGREAPAHRGRAGPTYVQRKHRTRGPHA